MHRCWGREHQGREQIIAPTAGQTVPGKSAVAGAIRIVGPPASSMWPIPASASGSSSIPAQRCPLTLEGQGRDKGFGGIGHDHLHLSAGLDKERELCCLIGRNSTGDAGESLTLDKIVRHCFLSDRTANNSRQNTRLTPEESL